jgi:PhnB protein
MDQIELAPYIFFRGNCREAMEFYKNIFGGELSLMEYKNMSDDTPGKAELEGKLMNASLSGGVIVIRGADTLKASDVAKKVSLCLTGSDEAKLRKIFEGLSDGAQVTAPLNKEFWGDIFGTLTDKFGVDWMVDITPQG